MSLRSRLRRLGVEQEPPAPPALNIDAAPEIERLRTEVRAALGRVAAQPMRAPRMTLSELPFAMVSAPEGNYLHRRERLSSSTMIGEVAVRPAREMSAAAIAELALEPALAHTRPERWLFFDTETTGLSGSGALAFLVGLARLESDGCVVLEQLLLGEPEQESAVLAYVQAQFEWAEAIVSFNGKAFDRPLLDSRCVVNRVPTLPRRPHLDLLHVARRVHRPRLSQCGLQSMERNVLGLDRGPDLDGSEIPAVYSEFLCTGEALRLRQVVEHNYWDVLSMVGLAFRYSHARHELCKEDLASLARTLHRAGALNSAKAVADDACRRGASKYALHVRACVAKATGDHRSATLDWESLGSRYDDPRARLELAKVYEHVWKRPDLALSWAEKGTGEGHEQSARRLERLRRKLSRQNAR